MHAVYRPNAPQSCAQCEKAMSRTSNPDGCYFKDFFKMERGCPYKMMDDPALAKMYQFVSKCMDSWEVDDPGNTDPKNKTKIKKYGMSIEKFEFATKVHQVKPEDMLEAVSWATVGSKAAEDAKTVARKSSRGDRFK